MAKTTKIEWAESTWSPWYGCRHVSPGCDFCYAEVWAKRTGRDFSEITRASSNTFYAPLKWKDPRRIFTCSLSDFFVKEADPWREEAWDIIKATPQHTYLILTKRPGRMVWWLEDHKWLDNVWAGVSIEAAQIGKKRYIQRLELLEVVSAKVRFISAEPLLGPLDLSEWLGCDYCSHTDKLRGTDTSPHHIQWVIVGGESGPGARPMNPEWVRSIRDQCVAAKVPFFFKQWGAWLPRGQKPADGPIWLGVMDASEMYKKGLPSTGDPREQYGIRDYTRVGKKAAGAMLDGREWREIPKPKDWQKVGAGLKTPL